MNDYQALLQAEARSLMPAAEVEIVYFCVECAGRFEDPMLDELTGYYTSPCCKADYRRLEDESE